MCVLGGGEISGSRCDVASSWCLACLCFLQLMVYREFFMDTMQMVVAIPLCFGSFCTSLVARSVVQDSYKHRRILGRCYNKCLWGKARMGSAYHFNLLMFFFGTSHRHTTLTCHIFLGLPTILPKMKVVAIVYLFAKLAPLCLPSVSPLSPLLALCLLFSLLALACSCNLAWFPLLLHRWKLLSLTVLKRMRKRVATKEFVRRLRGSVSPKSDFGPRLDLVCTSFGHR